MTGASRASERDRPSILLLGHPSHVTLAAMAAFMRHGWHGIANDDIAAGLDDIDRREPDVVVVPLHPRTMSLDHLCTLANTAVPARRRLLVVWGEPVGSPLMSQLAEQQGGDVYASYDGGGEELSHVIGRWLPMLSEIRRRLSARHNDGHPRRRRTDRIADRGSA